MASTNPNASTAPGWFSLHTDANSYTTRATTIDVSLGCMDNYGLGTWDWTMYLEYWNGSTWITLDNQIFVGYVSETSPSRRSFIIDKACPWDGSYRVKVYLYPNSSQFSGYEVMRTYAFKVDV